MRALAHPVRLALLELIHERGTANATECSRQVGESPQSCSYHLRALAKWGFIRRVDSDDGRETRWQRAARSIRFETERQGTAAFSAASSALKATMLARDDRALTKYFEREHELPTEWRKAATLSSGFLHLTAEELEELVRRLQEVAKEFADRTVSNRPEGARRVDVMFRFIPRVDE